MGFGINFFSRDNNRTSLPQGTTVSETSFINSSFDTTLGTTNTNTDNTTFATNPNTPAFTDTELAEMFELAGVSSTEANSATSTVNSLAPMENAGFDLAELDETLSPATVGYIFDAYEDNSALRISRENQATADLMENLPKNTPTSFIDAFMYSMNDKQVA
jgi:hypothetical protein